MSTVVTNDKYVASVRKRIGELVQAMSIGEVCFLEGARLLSSLHHEAAVADDDPDFQVFVAIASETDHLPIGKSRIHWSPEALAKHQPELDSATKWAREVSANACSSLLERFYA
ncbi:hypothetical protein [Thauera humireducens]|uniref:hypothetical protein n=1 Tax=Thauera humireducens TaxID=1134435 RepID=UPI00311DD1AA